MSEKMVSAVSYGGGAVSVVSAMTLTDWGIVAGIVTAVGTFLLNYYFQRRRDRREQELHDLSTQRLKGGLQ